MSVSIRLRRIGKKTKGKPFFRISVFDKRQSRDARVIEELGYYNPTNGEVKIKKERLESWKKNGALLSATVKSFYKKVNK